jgi:hypothetical protein
MSSICNPLLDSWRGALQQVRLFRYRGLYFIRYYWP